MTTLSELNPNQSFLAIKKVLCERSLYAFTQTFWPAVEPATRMVEGLVLEAICQHLEACAAGDVRRLLINVPPGCMKSLISAVFFPAWVWGPKGQPSARFINASYSAHLTERDNERCLQLLTYPLYQKLWGDKVKVVKTGVTKIATSARGWKLATSVGGVSTGERADFIVIDDANSVRESESKAVLDSTALWLTESIPTRTASPERSVIINIQQRTSEQDATGTLLDFWDSYDHLMLPMEYDPDRHCATSIGFEDWRTEPGELLWPERFPPDVVDGYRKMGEYAYASQMQQAPAPRGGGVVKRDWFTPYIGGETPPSIYVVAALDTAIKLKETSDYYAFVCLALFQDPQTGSPRVLVLHAWRMRAEIKAVAERVAQSCGQLKADMLIIEDRSHGFAVQQELMKMAGGQRLKTTLYNPARDGDKMSRLLSIQPLLEDGLVLVPAVETPDGLVAFRAWAEPLLNELCTFPKAKHDDLLDAFVMGVRHLRATGFALTKQETVEDDAWFKEAPLQRRMALYPV